LHYILTGKCHLKSIISDENIIEEMLFFKSQ